jgi:protein gp37
MVLTKRPSRMRDFMLNHCSGATNIWLGVTAENQRQADKRIPILLRTPAALRFVSIEPMLEPVVLGYIEGFIYRPWLNPQIYHNIPSIDWVICGAETGPRKRIMLNSWAVSLYSQCRDVGVPFFFKRDSRGRRGKFPREFPKL